MAADEFVSRYEVLNMIANALGLYDEKQDKRHKENSSKLDRLIWLILGTLLAAVGSLILNLLMHLLK